MHTSQLRLTTGSIRWNDAGIKTVLKVEASGRILRVGQTVDADGNYTIGETRILQKCFIFNAFGDANYTSV